MLAASCGSDSDTSPPSIPSDSDAIAVVAGSSHTCALQQTGEIACWGSNEDGQLGDGTNDDSEVPVPVMGIDDATAIAAGGDLASNGHSCALRRDGTISCWGNNRAGQLGNGQSNDGESSSAPVQVAGIDDATAIAAGQDHSCALHQTGAVSCWGENFSGQLGNGQSGHYVRSSVPVKVTGITDATAIAAGRYHSCALHRGGTVSCWGGNSSGQLGNEQSGGTNYYGSSVPVRVVGITDATAITASGVHSCALHQDGTISCWGWNDDGQLGNVTYADSSVPVRVFSITDATAITASRHHSCALHQNGTVSCWGRNGSGQLGNGQSGRNVRSPAPVRVTGFGS